MLKKLIISTPFLLSSFSAYSVSLVDKPLLAKQCHELSQKIEMLSSDQTNECLTTLSNAAILVERSGQFILKEYWYNARTDLHSSYRLLNTANQMQCKTAAEISTAQKGIDAILNQIYGLE